jgi:diguanylate cyclase (GGDEF)-like protein/PAS domain S-box-containing protein
MTLHKQTILIVDDQPANIQILAEALQPSYEIMAATSGLLALELARQEDQPDLILLDIMMPGIDGYEVCRRLKKSERTKNISIIFVTSHTASKEEEFGLNLGAVDYISKPYSLPIVIARVRNHLNIKQSERILEQSRNLLNKTQKMARIGSWEQDLVSDTLIWSEELYRLLEMDPKQCEPSFEAFWHHVHPEDLRMVTETHQKSVQDKTSYDLVYRLLMPDGRIKTILKRVETIYQDENLIGFIGSMQDITSLKRSEEEKLKLASLVEMSSDFIGITSIEGNVIYLNNAALTLVGLDSMLECSSIKTPDFFPEELAGFVRDDLMPELLTKGHWHGESSYRHFKTGELIAVDIRAFTIFNVKGQPIAFANISSDIRDRKKNEAALRIAATTFESQEGMVVTDANNMILRVNRSFTETTGYTEEEVVGKNPSIFKSGRHSTDFYREMWENINRTGGWQGEIWGRRKNGEEYPKWLNITSVKDSEGNVINYVGVHYDITDRKNAVAKINELAFFDHLTGLPNRALLLDRLKQAITTSSRTGRHIALLLIDLDNFKTLNDTLGHDVGDLLLKQVAQRLTICIREDDTIARLGGDEFVVMLTNLSEDGTSAANQAETISKKILAALNQTYQLNGMEYHNTPSIGVTLFSGNPVDIEALLKQADIAMYRAKDAGRNTLRFFDTDMETVVVNRANLENDIRKALLGEQFLLYYQAQIGGGQLVGVEALVRWCHPQRGMVSPADFIPLAEETRLILPLGSWVLKNACTQLALWATKPELSHLTVAVNISARQFHQANFVDQVLETLHNTGANPQKLKLEITESLLISNIDSIIEKMFTLKAKGISFSLDDFGTGYSSLSYLKKLPLDQLKIDQSFVRDVLIDPNDASIVKTIIALGQSLGFAVIAEGVETEEQKDFLASSGCYTYQGYLFSRPLPVQDFEEFAKLNCA